MELSKYHIQIVNHNVENKKDLILVEFWDFNKNWYSAFQGMTKNEIHEIKLTLQEKIKFIKDEIKKDKLNLSYYSEKLERYNNYLSELNKHGAFCVWYTKDEYNKTFIK